MTAALASIATGTLLRDHDGGAQPLMTIFPILMFVALRWGSGAGILALMLGTVGAWYVYVGTPFSFEITAGQTASLITAVFSGGLILVVCNVLNRTIIALQTANASAAILTSQLTERSVELTQLNANLQQALQEQVRSQKATEFSESQFRVSFEYAAVGKVQSDPHTGTIIRVNQAFADMLGYMPEELIGTDGWSLTFNDDVGFDREAYDHVLNGSSPRYIREKRYVRSDGNLIWVRVSAVIVRDRHDGTPLLTVSVIENIDDQRRYKLALEKANSSLERTLKGQSEALRQRDVLIREVYHRVKNNLQVVDGLIMLHARRVADSGMKAQLQQIRDRIFALGLVHHQLMDSGDLQTFDVGPFLAQLVDNLAQASVSQQVAFEVHAGPIKVDLDFAVPFGLVVTELVTNSLKHAFNGNPGRIMIDLQEDRVGALTLHYSDDGALLPPQEEIAAPNSGIGMKIVAGLLEQVGGRLHREGLKGTDYRIVFDRRDINELAG